MSAGVIYGVVIDRGEVSGPMKSGPVVTVCARLPEWCVLDGATETVFRLKLQETIAEALKVVTESEASSANRAAQNLMGSKT